ncbi:MAG: hypothetical protein HRU09_03835 [Oligoflexales bacterium]|nr:hypothetical protein [Oligoflexales bacterium]
MNELTNVLGTSLSSIKTEAYTTTFPLMLLIALLYGIMLNLLYSLYFRDNEPRDASLARSLVLLTPTLTTIFWVIQYSLPLSVGLLGALSFVRFRSPVKRAEDISFIVIALACAISCAIIKPLIGGGLILLFLAYAVVRNYLLPETVHGKNFAVLTYNTSKSISITDFESILKSAKCSSYDFISSRTYDGITSFVFNVANLKKSNLSLLTQMLEQTDKASQINVFYPNGRLGA